jgi:hypothetical protein
MATTVDRDPTGVDVNDMSQYTEDTNSIGDISWKRKTVQTKMGQYKLWTNKHWGVPAGVFLDSKRKKKRIRSTGEVELFLKDNDYFDPLLNPNGKKSKCDTAP